MDRSVEHRGWRLIVVLSALVLPAVAAAQASRPSATDGAASRARQEEEAVREKVEKVQELFTLAGVATGARVADVGAGGGFLTTRLARAVGPGGRVYAVDVSADALEYLRARVREEALDNVDIIQGAADDPRLTAGSLDAVIMLNAFHEMSSPAAMLAHVSRALKPTGRLVMMEPTSRLVAPDRAAQRTADVLSVELAEADLRSAGFHVAEVHDPFSTQMSGRYLQWLIVAHRAPAVLFAASMQPAAGRAPDGRRVVSPPGANDDPTRADLRLSVDEARKHVDAHTAVIVDLRSYAEYGRGHIPGALSMLTSEIDSKAPELASFHKPVIAYCG